MLNTDEIAELQNAFLLAMCVGYAFDAPARLEEATGAKLLEYTSNGHIVEDRWWNGRDGYSHGITLIRSNGSPRPCWGMSYCGPYSESATPCMKLALRAHYSAGKFEGGRGPRRFVHEDMVYVNLVDGIGLFQKFSGIEMVTVRGKSRPIGSYRYIGGLMRAYPD